MIKLYHYVHCPFCIRIRMVCGALNLPYDSIVLRYDDEKTPIDLKGVKMLPIMDFGEGDISNESLDIIKRLDSNNILNTKTILNDTKFTQFEDLLNKLGNNIHSLAMPYWMYTPEFDEKSRSYFQNKKESKRGPFSKLVQNRHGFLNLLNKDLEETESLINPYFHHSKEISLYDILLASHLWGLYIVPEFQFSMKLNTYLQDIAKRCSFDYHIDFWRSN